MSATGEGAPPRADTVDSVRDRGPNEADRSRAADLARMKRAATGLLLVVAAVFVVARSFENRHGWLSYVRATAEAAMVGALADWFAVTALFRHPLGIPVPHTAIIPRRKDQLGRGLGEFVQSNFADPDQLVSRVVAAQPAERAAAWLEVGANRASATRFAVAGLRRGVELLRDDEASTFLGQFVLDRLEAIPAAPLAGRALDVATADGRHEAVLSSTLRASVRLLDEQRAELWARFQVEAPWWLPQRIDERIFDRLFFGVRTIVAEMAANPRHPIRRRIDRRLAVLAHDLQTSDALREKGEQFKHDLLSHPVVKDWAASLWHDAKAALIEQTATDDSELIVRLERLVADASDRLSTDAALRDRLDRWLAEVVRRLAAEHGHEVARLISSTVDRWDGDETARRLELQVGRDLQFIRINGTLVGGLAGLAIHSISRLWG